ERLSTLLEIGSLGTPVPVKGRYFFTRREGKQNQPILYVREGVKGEDRVLVDPNKLAGDGTTALDWWFPSRDGKRLVYGVSKDGTARAVPHILDVEPGREEPSPLARCRACWVAWLPDSSGFYYTRYPAAGTVPEGEENYHRHVFFHRIGDAKADEEVFGAGRAKEDWPNVTLSPDGRWLVVTEQQGWAKTEVDFRDRPRADSKFVA